MVILDVNRRRSICSWFEYVSDSAAIFFLPTSSSPSPCFVRVALFRSRAIEGWRGVVRSMPMCMYAVGVYTYEIYGGSYRVNYVVYVWTGRMCGSVGVRYIYLISMFYNAVDIVYDYDSLTCLPSLFQTHRP